MAKVTIILEDVENGVSITMDSDPAFPGPNPTPEQVESFTDAMHWGIEIGNWLAQQSIREHEHDENCSH